MTFDPNESARAHLKNALMILRNAPVGETLYTERFTKADIHAIDCRIVAALAKLPPEPTP